jgi:rhamnosyltransferase
MEASIIILAKNEEKTLPGTLDMVFRQAYDGEWEVVVIDSGSTDRSVEIARSFPVRLEQIPPEDFHHGRTRNLGAEMARGRKLVYLGADATPADDKWLGALISELEPEDVAGSYGRQLPREWARPAEQYFLNFLYGPERRVQRWQPGRPLDMETTLFSNVTSAVKRELWERWPWSSDVTMSEDQVWSRQVLQAGYAIVYTPEAAVYHTHNYTLKQAFRRFFDSGSSASSSYLSDDGKAFIRFAGQSLRYLAGEMGFMLKNGHMVQIPHALVYEGAKYSGLLTGRVSHRLPSRLVRRIRYFNG